VNSVYLLGSGFSKAVSHDMPLIRDLASVRWSRGHRRTSTAQVESFPTSCKRLCREASGRSVNLGSAHGKILREKRRKMHAENRIRA
jgi:hypothetical protein